MTDNTVKLLSVGDIFLGEHPFTLGHGVTTSAKNNGCDFLFADVESYIKNSDIACGNLEGIISPKLDKESGIQSAIFWGESKCADAMQRAGFNCLFLANNHTAQHGIDALKRTCNLLDGAGIKWTGFNEDDANTPKPVVFSIKGIKIGILAYCDTQQYHLDLKILPIIEQNKIKQDVEELKNSCDIVVVSLHWGDEFIEYPSPKQVDVAHAVIDSGANLILGHHSHILQGIEEYNNGVIVYSLGTFIKDLWRKDLRESIIFTCTFTKQGILEYKYIPICINRKNYQPKICDPESASQIDKRIKTLSDKIIQNQSFNNEHIQEKYNKEVKRLARHDKLDNLMHYLLNLWRYDKKLLFQNIILILKRRMVKKNI